MPFIYNILKRVTTQIVMFDFFTGTTIDTAKWNVTNPADSVTVSQNNELIIEGDGSELIGSFENSLDSDGKAELPIGEGTIQVTVSTTQTTLNTTPIFQLNYADTGGGINRAVLLRETGTGGNDIRIIVTEDGTIILNTTKTGNIENPRRYRISYNGTNVLVDRWSGTAWINEATQAASSTFFTGTAHAILAGGNSTGGDNKTHTFDNFYMTKEIGYTTVVPV